MLTKIPVSAKSGLKRSLKKILYFYPFKKIFFHKGDPTGFDLEIDLGRIITQENHVCIDVGANSGQTIEMFQRAFKTPHIYSFEPSTKMYAKLCQKFSSPSIKIIHSAVGAEEGKQEFINNQNPALSSFLKMEEHKLNPFNNTKEVNKEVVNIKTIDNFVKQENIEKISILKTDTQGYDLEVLQGAEHTLKSGLVDYILIELNFVPMYEGQATAENIQDFLSRMNFHLIDYYEVRRTENTKNTMAWCTALFGKR